MQFTTRYISSPEDCPSILGPELWWRILNDQPELLQSRLGKSTDQPDEVGGHTWSGSPIHSNYKINLCMQVFEVILMTDGDKKDTNPYKMHLKIQ